jgi:hypothetical protein
LDLAALRAGFNKMKSGAAVPIQAKIKNQKSQMEKRCSEDSKKSHN